MRDQIPFSYGDSLESQTALHSIKVHLAAVKAVETYGASGDDIESEDREDALTWENTSSVLRFEKNEL